MTKKTQRKIETVGAWVRFIGVAIIASMIVVSFFETIIK